MTMLRNLGTIRSPALQRRGLRRAAPLSFFGFVLLGLGSCNGGASGAGPVSGPQVYAPVGRDIHWNASSAERFGFDRSAFRASAAPALGGLGWTVPAGWTEQPATALRLANFRVAGDEHAECYLTSLSGLGGGLAGNANRWRSQMGQAPLSDAELAALPRVPWMGKEAVLLRVDGTFGGMSGDAASEGYSLEGLLLVDAEKSWFLKMVGPRERIAREHEAFLQLAASIHDTGSPASAAAVPAPAAQPQKPVPDEPAPAAQAAAYRWIVPSGWRLGPEKTLREVTLLAGDQGEVECYVSSLLGEGGGLLSNVNRWRSQLGQAPLAESELAALPRFPMLGAEGVAIEIERGAQKPDGPEMVLGAVCILPRQSVFVKLSGPRAAVEVQRASFLEFCRSLEAAR